MVQRSILAVPYKLPVLIVCFLACVATGLELFVNNHAADFSLSTRPVPAVSLSCQVQSRNQAEELVWYRGEEKVDLKDENKVNISNICISPVTESDNRVTFTCQLARDKSVQVSVLLDVQWNGWALKYDVLDMSLSPPRFFAKDTSQGTRVMGVTVSAIDCKFLGIMKVCTTVVCYTTEEVPPQLTGEESLQTEEDKDVTMTCNAKSNPQAQTAWYKNNTILTLQQNRYHLYQTSEVIQFSIQKVQKSDNGTYTCVVKSSLGEGRKDFHLIVEDKKHGFPKEAVIAAVVVVTITVFFGIVARKDKFFKCFKRSSETAL